MQYCPEEVPLAAVSSSGRSLPSHFVLYCWEHRLVFLVFTIMGCDTVG